MVDLQQFRTIVPSLGKGDDEGTLEGNLSEAKQTKTRFISDRELIVPTDVADFT